jgi:hypothetical protein
MPRNTDWDEYAQRWRWSENEEVERFGRCEWIKQETQAVIGFGEDT